MIDYTQPPVAYLVRVPQADQDSPLDAGGQTRAEEAARFLSYEQIGPVVSSAAAAAVETAEAIFAAGTSSQAGAEVDDRLALTLVARLDAAWRDGGPPLVIVCRAEVWMAANVCTELVAPGGIVSLHREGNRLLAVPRTLVLDFTLADAVETICAGA